MSDFLAVLFVIWLTGSVITVVVSFICGLVWPSQQGRGTAVLVFLLSLGSMIGALIVGN